MLAFLQRTLRTVQGQTNMRLLQRYVIRTKFQALALNTITFFGVRATGSQWEVAIVAINQIETMMYGLILTANTTATIGIFNTGCNLCAMTGETTYFKFIPRAGVIRKFSGGLQVITGLFVMKNTENLVLKAVYWVKVLTFKGGEQSCIFLAPVSR